MVNYSINPIPREVDSGEIWGDQDLNFDSISDNGEIPLYMSINANEGYTVTSANRISFWPYSARPISATL